MTDKELIKQEIERRYSEYKALEDKEILLDKHAMYEDLCILQFIDSLPEEHNEDLDYLVISLEETIGTSPHSREVIKEHLQKAAEWQKQQMMKDAVELHIVESFNPVGTENEKPHGFTALCYNAEYPDFYPVTGQTIKVIPTKEIQQ